MSKSKNRKENLARIYRKPWTCTGRKRKRTLSPRCSISATWSSLLTWGNNRTWVILISRVISCSREGINIKMHGCKVLRNKMIWWLQIKWKNESKRKVLGGEVCMIVIRMIKFNRSRRMKIRTKKMRKIKNNKKRKRKNKIINLNNNKPTPWHLNPMKSNNWFASCFPWTNQQTPI